MVFARKALFSGLMARFFDQGRESSSSFTHGVESARREFLKLRVIDMADVASSGVLWGTPWKLSPKCSEEVTVLHTSCSVFAQRVDFSLG
jgi:hypothetical protein